MAIPMGIGSLGGSNLIFKQKNHWTFAFQLATGIVPSSFVKVSARPNWTTEDIEINYLNGKTWIPGKTTLETITITYYDVATVDNQPLWNWLATVYNFTDPVGLSNASQPADYTGIGTLVLYDGCGGALEQWTLGRAWPTSVNFGELDMSSGDPCEIELTLRYSQIEYKSLCPGYIPVATCNPCTGTTGSTSAVTQQTISAG